MRDNCSLTTLNTSPETYTSVCFESQTVASNYQELPNKKASRLRYGHKNREYQSVGYQSGYGAACERVTCLDSVKCLKIIFLPVLNL